MKCDDVKSAYSVSFEMLCLEVSVSILSPIFQWYLKHKNYFKASGETRMQRNSRMKNYLTKN